MKVAKLSRPRKTSETLSIKKMAKTETRRPRRLKGQAKVSEIYQTALLAMLVFGKVKFQASPFSVKQTPSQ